MRFFKNLFLVMATFTITLWANSSSASPDDGFIGDSCTYHQTQEGSFVNLVIEGEAAQAIRELLQSNPEKNRTVGETIWGKHILCNASQCWFNIDSAGGVNLGHDDGRP